MPSPAETAERKPETTWTPGAWEVRPAPYGRDVFSIPPLVDGAYEHPMTWVCGITFELPIGNRSGSRLYPTAEECSANARLISAAPDLHEALRRAVHFMQNAGVNIERDYPEIDAALCKARGEG